MTNQHDRPTSNPPQSSQIIWSRALVRSGFLFQAKGEVFDLSRENDENQTYLQSILTRLAQQDRFTGNLFTPRSTAVDETAWLAAIEQSHSGAEGGLSGIDDCDLKIMDTYMAGLVRWINAIGIMTTYSCDGHENRDPIMNTSAAWEPPLIDFIFQALSSGKWRFNENRLFKHKVPRYRSDNAGPPYDRHWLLDVAEALHQHQGVLREVVTAARTFTDSIPSVG